MGEYIKCITLCNKMLTANPKDDTALALKIQAITEQNTYPDTDLMVDNGTIDILNVDNNNDERETIKTSLSTATGNTRMNLSIIKTQNMSKSRSGYLRPETQLSISKVTSHDNIRKILKTGGTKAAGSKMRTTTTHTAKLATTAVNSVLGVDGVDIARMDPKIYTDNMLLRQIVCDFLLFVQKDSVSVLELLSNMETSTSSRATHSWWHILRTGMAHLMAGRVNDAERFLRQANAIIPRTVIFLLLGNAALRRDELSQAISVYDNGILSFSQSPDLDLAIARAHEIIGDKELALRMYDKVLEQDPSCIEAIACSASLCMELRDIERAFSLYTRLLVFGVRDPAVLANLAICFQYMNDTTNALWFQIRAIEAGEIYLSQHGEEADDYSMIIADMWYNAGLIFCRIADFFAASKCFNAALGLRPGHPEATTGLAFIALYRGRKSEACAALDSLAEMEEAPTEGLLASAHMAFERGDMEQALASAQRALLQPRGAGALRMVHAIKERVAMK